MGLMAGPDSPPILLASMGLVVSVSIVIARTVLIAVMAFAPALTADDAISVMSATLGVSLTMMGFVIVLLTVFTTFETRLGFCPISEPVFFTWGQDTFSSTASAPAFVRICAVWAYSFAVYPNTLAITGAFSVVFLSFVISLAKCCAPGLGRPIAFSRLWLLIWTMVGLGYPGCGFRLVDFVTTAPAPWRIASCRVGVVSPSMPAASMVGLDNRSPVISVASLLVIFVGFGSSFACCSICG